jgi:hypothetical protein
VDRGVTGAGSGRAGAGRAGICGVLIVGSAGVLKIDRSACGAGGGCPIDAAGGTAGDTAAEVPAGRGWVGVRIVCCDRVSAALGAGGTGCGD